MRACLGILVVALLLRLLHAWQMASSPLYDEPAVDGMTYVAHAEALAAGDWLGRDRPAFWQPPLYPYVLGLVKAALPDSFFHAVRWIQALWGALACALTCLLGARLFSPRVGLAAGLAAALCGPLIYFDGEILPASLATVLGLSGLLLLLRALRRGTPGAFVPAGLVYGLAALAVPTVLGFCLLAALWIAWKGPSLRAAALFLLAIAAAILPVAWRNHAIGGDRVLISYNSGINFHIGNSADHDRLVKIRPGWEWDDLVAEPVKAGIVGRSERSAWFWKQALEYMREEPLDYLALQARKSLRLLDGHEEGRNQDIYYWRHYSGVLAATLWKRVVAFPFGLVAPLALLGLALAVHRRGLDPTTLFVLAYAAGVVAFFPTSRYRAPLLPVLLVLAAHAAWWLWDRLREGRYRRAVPAVAAAAGVGLVGNLGAGPMDMAGDAAIHYNIGQAHSRQGRAAEAGEALARAVELDPAYWQAWNDLGTIHARQGDAAGAAAIFERVTRARPDRPEPWVNLAHSRRALGRLDEAVPAYERALSASGHLAALYAELMHLHLERGDPDAARQTLDEALERRPDEREGLLYIFARLQSSGVPGRRPLRPSP